MSVRSLSYLTLLLLALLGAACATSLLRLRFNYNFNDFYPTGDPDLAYYEQYSARFGNDNDYVLVGLEAPAGRTLFDADFAQRVDTFTRFAQRQPNVVHVLSPTTAANPVVEGLGVFNVPYLHLDRLADPASRAQDSSLIFRTPGLVGNLFARNARAVTVLLQTTPDLKKPPGDSLMASLRQELSRLGIPDEHLHLGGKLVAQSVFVDRLKVEMAVFVSLSVLLVMGLLWLTFRTWWGVLLPLTVVAGATVGGLALVGWSGAGIDLMTALLPVMMCVVGIADSVHFLTRYVTETGEGTATVPALRISMRESMFGSGLSALTTSLGFFTLTTSHIRPIHNFGLYTGLAVLLAYALTFTLLPALLVLLPRPQQRFGAGRSWDGFFRRLLHHVLRRRHWVVGAAALLLIGGLTAASQVRIESRLLDDLADDDPVQLDFRFFEQRFAGVRPFELNLQPQGNRSVYDLAVLRQTEAIEQYLTRTYGLHFVASPVTVVKSVRKALNGGALDEYRLPATEAELARLQRQLRRVSKRPEFRALATPDGLEGRLTGRMPDPGSSTVARLNAGLHRFLRARTDSTVLRTRLTGSALLIDKNNQNLTRDMLLGIGVDVLMVTVIVLLLFRSLRMVPVVLVPNLLPIVVVGGVMGVCGVPMKVSTSIIFTIAFGIAVDDTIHFISKLRLMLGKEPTVQRAVSHTYRLAGKAVIVTSLILVGGFSTLLFSSFDGTFYVGLLIGLTLLVGVVAELTLLPILILAVYKKPRVGRARQVRAA
ncbi:MMPL family transporter [Hymenobacter busanensis]|uniref:MMPL family transporter n=1 Tax=Hymenobacter busanensis TaxID=2607656 RepID=A0A7L4ZTZ0_9BACT|nr:MMPL family transporter [Hymenobacter busanensis]KAA9325865.1 MMPL family transporter [Hymenobacter busanensis]QHJ06295.1 MMPL family transporter [Hymenobacter busanensis]